ncbi:MAG: PAS domain S-box protein, partial [Gallionellaceae bacterium]
MTSILLVEDDPMQAEALKLQLIACGYQVAAVVSDGQAAIEKSQALAPDVVLMDIVLSGIMDGIETAKTIRESCDIPVLYLTAYADEKFFQRAKVTEPHAYLLKPSTPREIQLSIEIALYHHKSERTALEILERTVIERTADLDKAQSMANVGSWRLDLTSGQLTWSSMLYRIYGICPESYTPSVETCIKLIHPDDQQPMQVWVEACASEQKPEPLQCRSVWPDGTIHFVEMHGELTLDIESNSSVVNGTCQDITQQKQSEEILRQSEERFQAIIENIPVALVLNDEQGNITYLNAEFVRSLGYTKDDILTLADWWPRAYPDLKYRQWVIESWQQHLDEAKRKQKTFAPLEVEITCKEGNVRTFMASAVSLEMNFTHDHLVMLYDITERKKTESTVSKLSLAVEQSPNSIIITDLDARIEYTNRAFTQLTGYSMDEAIGKNPSILKSGKTSTAIYADMWRCLTGGEVWRGELLNRRKDSTEYNEFAIISPVRQADGKVTHFLAIQEDITDKKLAAARIEKLSNFDLLTGLPNRSRLNDRFQNALNLAQRSGENLTLIFLDLDNFKDINDSLGHSIGDQLLMAVGRRIKAILREEDTVARLGGDEFVILLPGTEAIGATQVVA